jgi:hypothetical protein
LLAGAQEEKRKRSITLGELGLCGRSVGVGKLSAISYLFNSLYPAVYEVKNTFLRKVVNKAKLLTKHRSSRFFTLILEPFCVCG